MQIVEFESLNTSVLLSEQITCACKLKTMFVPLFRRFRQKRVFAYSVLFGSLRLREAERLPLDSFS